MMRVFVIFFALAIVPHLLFAVINPAAYLHKTPYYSTGIVSYGLYNSLIGVNASSGNEMVLNNLTTYTISTNAVYGCVNINSISAYDPDPPPGSSPGEALLQFNAELNVAVGSGATYAYYVQEVVGFNTSNDTYTIFDSILNNSSPTSENVSHGTFDGRGSTINYYNYTYYKFDYKNVNGSFWQTYDLPFHFCPIIEVANSTTPTIKFGYLSGNTSYFYDNVSFLHQVRNMTLIVQPFYVTPYYSLYELSLVFSGTGPGGITTFRNLSATDMWIFYYAKGTFIPIPSAYSSDLSNFEGATNLQVLPSNDYATITTGAPHVLENIELSGQGNATYTPDTIALVPPSYGHSQFNYAYIVLGVAAVIIVVFAIIIMRRKGSV